ncbi:phage baseplate assembly protein W [Rivularia sp. PCC 7116]|uniref:GPW/gp25 family protein n=1 Tax=Rivularia sp. PCC 7116 TaxID=373994 RepID=UPI00029EE3C9|nr:GPW/gp25 family protein [Rivularia sp. PCC 7116]AFY57590.1 phage baseplate assembly protein W [Rivularia sp. PCC 7116]
MQQINYPFLIDNRGRIASPDYNQHIRQMIEQVLFTFPGERVNRPDFGTGLQQLIFDPNGGELAAATQFLVQGALEQWLGDLIELEAVEVENQDSKLTVTIQYIVKRTQEQRLEEFSREI